MALKVGVVGMGGIGHTHCRCYKNDELAELICVCDLFKDRADQAAEEFGVEAFYTLKEMISAHPELDIVDITTSGFENGSQHFEPAYEALEAGKNVLVEKPICTDVREARELVNFASRQKLYLGCDLNHYFTDTANMGLDYIKQGKIGEPVYLLQKMGFNGSEMQYGGKGSLRWQMPYSHLKAFLAHPFSVMRRFGGDITHIQAFMNKPGVRKSADDPMLSINSVHMQFANGSVGYIISQRGDASFGLGGWWCFEMAGTKGTFCIENCVEKITYWTAGQEPVVTNTGITSFDATFPNRIHAFLEDITNQVPREFIRASGRDALATLEYTFAVIESYENGGALVRPYPLPTIHGHGIVL